MIWTGPFHFTYRKGVFWTEVQKQWTDLFHPYGVIRKNYIIFY